MMITGIDIASHQHPRGAPIDYSAVTDSGVEFVSVKATEWRPTDPYRNPFYWQDVQGFRDAGSHVGAYMWFTPNPGQTQAGFFCDTVGRLCENDLRPMIDVEEEGVDGEELLRAIDYIDARLDMLPFLYGGANPKYNKPLIQCVNQCPELAEYPLWVASYGFSIEHGPGDTGPWDQWAVWQHTSSGQVPGIQSFVDMNLMKEVSWHYYHQTNPLPVPQPKVKAMYDPSFSVDVVASCPGPNGQGSFVLGRDGGVFIFHAPVTVPNGKTISPVGQDYWEQDPNREGAEIALNYHTDGSWDGTWTVTSNFGETYTYPA